MCGGGGGEGGWRVTKIFSLAILNGLIDCSPQARGARVLLVSTLTYIPNMHINTTSEQVHHKERTFWVTKTASHEILNG